MYTAWLTGSSIINGCCHSLDTHTDFYIKFTTLREIKNVTHINEWRVALISLPRNHVSLQDTENETDLILLCNVNPTKHPVLARTPSRSGS